MIHAAALANCFEGISVQGKQIIEAFGSIDSIFNFSRREAVEHCPQLGPLTGKLFSAKALEDAQRDIEWAESNNLRIITIEDGDYPSRLRECPDKI